MNKIKVLHITPHFGGGVGSVLMSLVLNLHNMDDFEHEIVSLEYANEKAKNWSSTSGIKIYDIISPVDKGLHDKMQGVDIVHIHFWNHPLLYQLLHSFSGRKARAVMWSHVNGHYAPYLFNDAILDFPEIFVTATDFSLTQKNITKRSIDWQSSHIRSIPSCSGLNNFDKIEPIPHDTFNIGYTGTVDYCKIHPEFIDMLNEIDIQNARFIIVGGDSHKSMEEEARKKGGIDKFRFTGKVPDVKKYLAEFDLFAYPLRRENYGTGEQVLIEAMSAGIPQVVFAGGPEEYIVQDNLTGFAADSKKEFIDALQMLYSNDDLRKKMSDASKKYAKENFTIDKSVVSWANVYQELLSRPKSECIFNISEHTDSPVSLFLTGLGECDASCIYKDILKYYPDDVPYVVREKASQLPLVFKGNTRGSIKHYNAFFDDEKLKYLEKYGTLQ
ncbi:MAG: glycosyltransferase family 4 protein [Desulfobacteraceae bacterium]|jgi:glycosyltransferase involved in cell wall biosynthesis